MPAHTASSSIEIPNQVFIGLPWRNFKKRYDGVIDGLHRGYPIYFTIVGRDERQDARDLFGLIKERIDSSSYAIFDATGGNANVSLEYGYAEGRNIDRAIYVCTHGAHANKSSGAMIADLAGSKRNQYTNDSALRTLLERVITSRDYYIRFERALAKANMRATKGQKKSRRNAWLKGIRALDNCQPRRRVDLVNDLSTTIYDPESALRELHKAKLIAVSVGRYSDVRII